MYSDTVRDSTSILYSVHMHSLLSAALHGLIHARGRAGSGAAEPDRTGQHGGGRGSGGMEVEKRMSEDCEWYTRKEFDEFYGPEAAEQWERSPPRGHEWVAIFHCAKSTEQECVDRKLLGGPLNMRKALATPERSVCEGTALLLFNFQTRQVLAPYRAAGPPGRNLEKEAWGGRFPWQVRTTGTAKRWSPPRGGGSRLTSLLKKNGSWISSHMLPDEWFPRPSGPTSMSSSPAPLLAPSDAGIAETVGDTVPPTEYTATRTENAVFSNPPSSEGLSDALAPEIQDELSMLTTSQRHCVQQVIEVAGLTTAHVLRLCRAADFDANRATNFAFAELPPSPVALNSAPAHRAGPSYGDTNPFDTLPSAPTAGPSYGDTNPFDIPPNDDLGNTGTAVATATTWQQQQEFNELGAMAETEEWSCHDCGQTGEGATDPSDGQWYCLACWDAMAQAGSEPPQIVYMKLSQSPPVFEAERRFLVVLNAFGIPYREHKMAEDKEGNYVIRDEIEAAKAEAPHVCILSVKSALGRASSSKIGIIWDGERSIELLAWNDGMQKIMQLGKKMATASPEDCPEVAKLRDYLVHKVIIAKFQRLLVDGPETAAANMSGSGGGGIDGQTVGDRGSKCMTVSKTAHSTAGTAAAVGGGVTAVRGGVFAALQGLCDVEWSDGNGEASPAVATLRATRSTSATLEGSHSSYMLARLRTEPQRLQKEALKSAAKLMSTYFFRDLAEDNFGSDEARVNLCREAWRRAGDRHDPMIPSNENAWPNVRIAFGLLLERWWGVKRHDPIVQASMDELMKWCRTACHKLEERASARHNPNLLHPDWQDDESGVEMVVRGADSMVWLKHGRVEVKLDSQRLDFLHALLSQHSPDHVKQINTRIYNCVLRYETLAKFDQGTQGSLPERVFDVLIRKFGVDHECFASPLNVTTRSFNSVFADVDRFFGSKGSFFDFWPDTGSYEANPPFDEGSVAAMFQHMNAILNRAEEQARQRGEDSALPLLFITATPFVPSDSLCKPDCRFLLRQITLKAGEHAFTLGMRHRKSDEWRSTNDTIVCFIGNQAAANTWPITMDKLQLLREAWTPRDQ